jgi:hypothetical protein
MIAADRPEMEFRTYLTVNPWILSLAFGHGEGAVFSEYELAPGQRPDHLLLGGRSNSADVTLVELKRPSAGLLQAKGSMTEPLNNAISKTMQRRMLLVEGKQHYIPLFRRQIDDLVSKRRAHFKGVVDPLIEQKLRLPFEDYHVRAKIVIGSRARESEEERRFRRSYYDPAVGNVEIVPYDRILDFLRYPPHEAQTIEWLPARKAERRAYWEEERRKRSDLVFVVPVHDEELSYRSWRGTEGRFWARIFDGPAGTVALLTDIPYGEARPSVTNNIERAAQCVCERFGLEGRTITFIEHYDNRDERLALDFFSWQPEIFSQVTFEVFPSHLREGFARPKWVEMTKSDAERLVGGDLP